MPDHSPLEPVRTVVREPGAAPVLTAPIQGDDLPDIPGYEVHREIARGAMGRVLAARDLSLDREVAIKIILAGEEASDARLRFVRESKITARLPHPGVPPVYAIGSLLDGRPYLAMKLVGGTTLADQLKGRPNPTHNLPRFVQVFEQIAQTVAFAHAEGVIHRDLKPANVMVGAFGEVQVMDWGIARLGIRGQRSEDRGQEAGAIETDPLVKQGDVETWPLVGETSDGVEALERTREGQIMGSPAYMSPEQARGEVDRVDARSDVFSLGAILCEILTGRIPFKAKTPLEVLQLVAACDLTEVSARLDESGGDAELLALTKRCLAPDPVDRPANGKAVADAVAAYRAGVEDRLRKAQADRAATEVRVVEGLRRRKVQKIAVAVVIGVLAVGIAGTTIGLFREADQRKIAEQNERNALDAAEEERLARLREAEQKLIAQQKERDALAAAEEERKAKLREAEQRAKAEKARDRTRDVLDTMTSAVTGDSLATQKVITEEQKKFLIEVLVYYREFAGEKSDDERSRKRTAEATFKVGLIESRLGHNGEGATAFRMARDSYAALAADFPAVLEYRWNLAASHNDLGNLLQVLGERAEAVAECRKALAIWEKLAADFPAEPEHRSNLAGSHNSLGNLFADLGKPTEAEAEYRKALAIQEQLAIEFPTVPGYRQTLATSHNGLATLLTASGKQTEAEAEIRKALLIQEPLAADFPSVRQQLAVSHDNLGVLLKKRGKRVEAEEQYRKALAIREKLAADFPSVPEHRSLLSGVHNNLGTLLADDLGKGVEALGEYRKALAIEEKLAADFPTVPEYRMSLAVSHNNLGFLLKKVGEGAQAESEHRQALAIWEKLAVDFPAIPTYRQELAKSHDDLGIVLAELGKRAEAEPEIRKALKIKAKLSADYPTVPEYRQGLARTHYNLGLLLVELRKRVEAESEHRKALAIFEKLATDFPAVHEHRQAVARCANELGNLLAALDKRVQAEVEYRKTLAIRKQLAADFPAVSEYRHEQAQSHYNLGLLLVGRGMRAEAESEYRQTVAILAKLVADFPALPKNRQDLAMSQYSLGQLLLGLGKRAEAEGVYRQALVIFEKLVAEFPSVPTYRVGLSGTFYDLACLYAITSSKEPEKKQEYADRAMEMLHKAVKAGYTDAAHLAKDTDLDPLRDRADFKKLLASLQPKPKVQEKPREPAPPPRLVPNSGR